MKLVVATSSLDSSGGGVYEAARRLAQEAHRQGLETIVIGLNYRAVAEDIKAAWHPLPVRSIRNGLVPSYGYSSAFLPTLMACCPTLLHVHGIWMYPSLASFRWHRKTSRPYIISIHGMLDQWALRNARWKKRVAARLFERRALSNAACIHALCDAEAHAVRKFGLRNPICVIPNGVDVPGEPPKCAPPWTTQVKPGERVLLYLGRLHPKKNLPALLQAWARVRPGGWHLAIAGWDQANHEETLKQLLGELSADHTQLNVHFLGPLFGEQKAAALNGCAGLVLPSLSEGMPVAVLEAWSYVKPVLMTSECNLPEGFERSAAFRVHTQPDHMAPALLDFCLMTDTSQRQMGERGFQLVMDRFNWQKAANQMLEVYNWLVQGESCPECVVLR